MQFIYIYLYTYHHISSKVELIPYKIWNTLTKFSIPITTKYNLIFEEEQRRN